MRVDVEDLVLRYGTVTALDRMSFGLEGGKIYGLLGRNGSGKTSLLSLLGAFRKQTSGQVRVGGSPVFENPAVTPEICLVRESGECTDLGSAEDAFYFAEWLRPNWDGDYARSLLDLFGIDPKTNVKSMSKGQRSAMGVVVGLASRAPLTMFDESYLGMDAPARQAFYDAVLADYMAHPRTIILSTHLIEEVSGLFEEVLIIDGGKLLLHEESTTLLSRGHAVTGPVGRVEAFTSGLTVLGEKTLGPTRSAMVYGELDDERRRAAAATGLDLGPIAMQELFIHLTGGPR
ncbi:ABC transporter ATP-binding protein [Nonomuraea longicatena]|uniref:ABC transporter ATP-binding protein n=1 Tax=Nonomuraea longicatena TaxID=83682 RepID=A0ABN1NR26_9ACTN